MQQTLRGASVLVVLVGGRPYGLPVRDVIEVLDNVVITPVPGVAPSVRGVVRYERGVVAVVPLSRIVASDGTESAGSTTVVVIQSANTPVALEVDDVLEVIVLTDELHNDTRSRWLLGAGAYEGRALPVVDTRSVVAQLDDTQAVAS